MRGWEGGDADTWARAFGIPALELVDEVDSTNDRVLERARDGAPFFTTVVADTQRRGRGREGRRWQSEAGTGLWMSVLLPQPWGGPPGVTPLAVGVAVAEALGGIGIRGVRLKWPNDVVVAENGATSSGVPTSAAKICGILCEGVRGARQGPAFGIVAGIGINLRRGTETPPPEPALPMAWVEDAAGRPVSAGELAGHILAGLRKWADPPPDRLDGELRRAWEDRDLLAGSRADVATGPRGRVVGVRDDGALLIVPDEAAGDEPVPVYAGRVRIL